MTRYNDRTTMTFASQLILGLLLFAAPWAVGFATDQNAAWNAWIVGGGIALITVAGLAGSPRPAAWTNLALGLWALVAPWVLGFSALGWAMWSHLALGVLTALASTVELWAESEPTSRAHA